MFHKFLFAALFLAHLVLPASASTFTADSFNYGKYPDLKPEERNGNWHNPYNWEPPGIPGAGDSVVISDHDSVTLDASATIASLTISDPDTYLNGGPTGTSLTITQGGTWSGGFLGYNGYLDLNIGPEATFTISPTARGGFFTDSLNNAGTLNWTSGAFIVDGPVNNSGVCIASAPTAYFGIVANPGPVFNNSGQFIRSGGTGLVSFGGFDPASTNSYRATFNNTGSVQVESGTLAIGGGSSTGSFNVLAGATLRVQDSQEFDGTPWSGAGRYAISGGRSKVRGNISLSGGTVTLGGEGVVLQGGFDGEGGGVAVLTGTGLFEWKSGYMPGNWTLETGILTRLSENAFKTYDGNFKNKGTMNWLGGGPLATTQSTFINAGTFNVKAAGTFTADTYIYGGTFENRGTLNTFAGENRMDDTVLVNKGLLNIGGDSGIGTLQANNIAPLTGSITRLEFGGTAPEQYDRIVQSASITAGTLEVRLINGFQPLDQTFRIASGNGTGKFPVVIKPTGYAAQTSDDYYNSYVRLGKPHKITGRVFKTLSNGVQQGIPNVTMTRVGDNATVTAQTETNGNYSFNGLFAGTYTVSASKTSVTFSPASKTVTLPTSGTPLSPNAKADFQTFQISGRLTNTLGAGVAGATILLSGATTLSATTDTEGYYSFKNIGAGAFVVTPAAQSGYSFAPENKNVSLPNTSGSAAPNGGANFVRSRSSSGAKSSAKSQ